MLPTAAKCRKRYNRRPPRRAGPPRDGWKNSGLEEAASVEIGEHRQRQDDTAGDGGQCPVVPRSRPRVWSWRQCKRPWACRHWRHCWASSEIRRLAGTRRRRERDERRGRHLRGGGDGGGIDRVPARGRAIRRQVPQPGRQVIFRDKAHRIGGRSGRGRGYARIALPQPLGHGAGQTAGRDGRQRRVLLVRGWSPVVRRLMVHDAGCLYSRPQATTMPPSVCTLTWSLGCLSTPGPEPDSSSLPLMKVGAKATCY